ncbi:uncharacterized protein [Ptychodera flava]|uniref:uncharacterized protein n=1 Tax=Ptychodera flava TaxID=63121 RepID=UPI00396A6C47
MLASVYQPPRIDTFSGDPNRKGDAEFEIWRDQIQSLIDSNIYPPEALTPAVRRSLKGHAAGVLTTMRRDATVEQIIKKLEGSFGEMEDGAALLERFYRDSRQRDDETAVEFGDRLERAIHTVKRHGGIRESAIDEALMTVFWRNLKEDRVIDIARPQKEKCKTFEDLKKIVRIAEREVRDRASIKSQGKHTPARQSHQSVAAERTAVDEADSYGNMEKLLKAMTKPMQSLQDRIDELEKKQLPW